MALFDEEDPHGDTGIDADLSFRGRLPPLSMLRAFESTCRTGSMRRAAQDLGVDHTVVSHHMRNLQAWMRCKLFDAGPRGVSMTPEGKLLFKAVRRGLTEIAMASAEIRPSPYVKRLLVSCTPGLATRWLTPRLSEIEALLEGVEFSLQTSDNPESIDDGPDGANLLIGFGHRSEWPACAQPLVRPRMFPVASPSWINQHGLPASLKALSQRPLIHEAGSRQWADWFRSNGLALKERLTGPTLSNAALGLDAAVAGQGVALTTRLMAGDDLDSKRLIELFSTDIYLGEYYTSVPQIATNARFSKDFLRWLKNELTVTECPQVG
jgi:DNA-binding transcriptional LysR family regulator